MSFELKYSLLFLVFLVATLSVTCDNNDPAVPNPPVFDPLAPTIDSFLASRGSTQLTDKIVFSGEDINIVVQATSHAWPVSCGLLEGETVSGNLFFTYASVPPGGVDAPGLFSSKSPGENEAVWRVPNLAQYDSGEGLIYDLKVTVLDECLDKTKTGSLALRVFANQGPPVFTDKLVRSDIKTPTPFTELLDSNGYYEVEQGDQCSIEVTALSKTMTQICANRGVEEGDELTYSWSSANPAINLSFDQAPTLASSVEFDIPNAIFVSDIFDVECLITDQCSQEQTLAVFSFIIVGAPEITSLTGTADGFSMFYDPYFDNYPVLPGDEIVLSALANVKHPGLCDMKGISPALEWLWEETSESMPGIVPVYDPLPVPNDESQIEFIVPAAENGAQYTINCIITDQCNNLMDAESVDLLVIIPPVAEIDWVKRNLSVEIDPSVESGRYEVMPGDTISVRIAGSAASGTSFCSARGVTDSTPLEYYWENLWTSVITLNYETNPDTEYSDLVFIVPSIAQKLEVSLRCRITDICNGLSTTVTVPFEVIYTGE